MVLVTTHGLAAEGWFTDPYGRHEARWMSQGTATGLVRDGGVEAKGPAPNSPFTVVPVRIEGGSDPSAGTDLLRTDAAEDSVIDPKTYRRAAWTAWDKGNAW